MTFQIRQDDRVPEMNIDVKIKNDSGMSSAVLFSYLLLDQYKKALAALRRSQVWLLDRFELMQ